MKDILGHAQIRLTADLYGHIYMKAKQENISKLGEVLSPTEIPVAPLVAPPPVSDRVH